ncbi:HAD-IC family P-type ATPase [Candidatus Dependentiae bacterium]|nr:HAD-IC family P-type ATPase [Candidatus Dependentiae bacterium]
MKFYKKKIDTIISDLKTDLEKGLDNKKIKSLQKKYGKNEIKKTKKVSPLKIFFKQFLSPLMFILLISTALSIFIGEMKDAIIISAAVMLNVIVGFIQEWRAEKSVEALKKYEVLHSNVIRNGKKIKIKSKELVPGDIVLLSAGEKIPADIRLINVNDFRVNEALLTGESKPIKKITESIEEKVTIGDRKNMAFSGTNAVSGKAKGVVVTTGEKTEIGRIASLVEETKTIETPLQKQVKRFSWILGVLFLGIALFIFILGLIRGMSIYQIALTSIALGVAAIPEGLLVAVTVILAVGMQRMLKRKALVRHLVAAETLGSVSVICTDKTGTLTEGKMLVNKIISPKEEITISNKKENNILEIEEIKNIIIAGILNNDAQIEDNDNNSIGHPTEIAILKLADELNIDIEQTQNKYKRIEEIPFSSNLKYMATLHEFEEHEEHKEIIVKGAPEKIFEMCKSDNLKHFKNKAKEMAEQGLRILAFAQKETSEKNLKDNLKNLNFIGLIGIKDPLRPTAQETVEELNRAGVRVVLVTGDHKETAKNIAINAGIEIKNGTITGTELDELDDKELEDRIEKIDVFARVEPKHKIRIVDAWKSKGKSVAMTGDGVNDAPALKAADIGVALGSGSDVAHEISDMVLLDNNLSSIDAAVKEGRTIFDNIRKVIVYLMSDSFGEIVLIAGSLSMGLPLPILATQIFWINLITDGFPYLALTVEPPEKDIMKRKPRDKNESIINKQMKILIFIIGIVTDIGLFLLYFVLLKLKFELSHIRTMIFTALSVNSLLYILSVSNMHKILFKMNPFKNKWMLPAIILGLFTQISVVYLPWLQKLFYTVSLNIYEWIIIFILALIKITGIEIAKYFFIIKNKK